MAKKIISKVIVAILLMSMLLALAACGGDNNSTPTTTNKDPGTTPPTTTTGSTSSSDDYPSQVAGIKDKVDSSDNTIYFLYVEGGNGTYTGDSIWIDESEDRIASELDEKIIERNNKVYDDLGVYIEGINSGVGISGLQDYAKAEFDAPTGSFDVYCGYQYYDISLATQGHLVNLNTLVNDNGEKIIDVTKPYWATNYINSITYNDYLYWVTGDLSLRYTGGLYCTFVNTDIYDRLVKRSYDNKTIYQIVNDGDWTLDTMLAMANLGFEDFDDSGDATDGDTMGIVFETCDVMDGIAFGCKIAFGTKTRNASTGLDEISVTLKDNKRAAELADKLNTMYKSSYAYNAGNSDSQNMMPIFANGEALFAINKIYMATVYLSDMETYAIVPTPKLNSDQGNYATGVHDSLTIFGISKYSEKIEASAATLELMAYYGSKLVTPVYYESVMKGGKTVRDDEAPGMIDTIRAGFDSDFVAAWSASIDNIVQFYRSESNVKTFDKATKVSSKSWPATLRTLLTKLDEVANDDLV